MRTFAPIDLSMATLVTDLADLAAFLDDAGRLKERDHIIPFFKARPNLSAALALTNNSVEWPNRLANELDLFGDFVCDVAAGDSEANAFTLIEFEDANEHSIFNRLPPGKTMKRWSRRFETGASQLIDWAWRISAEGETSAAFRRVFGDDSPEIHLLLIVGRDADLTRDDLRRLGWRARHTSIGPYRMSCLTFDGLLNSLRRRTFWATQPSAS